MAEVIALYLCHPLVQQPGLSYSNWRPIIGRPADQAIVLQAYRTGKLLRHRLGALVSGPIVGCGGDRDAGNIRHRLCRGIHLAAAVGRILRGRAALHGLAARVRNAHGHAHHLKIVVGLHHNRLAGLAGILAYVNLIHHRRVEEK